MFSNSSEVAAGTKVADKVGDQKVDHMAIPLPSPALSGVAGASGGTTTVTENQLNDAANGVKATVDTVTDTVIGGIEF
ncbi:hypothetical protein L3V77_10565 [Vibrio sp. DW001]|uniref:hypothetical protein n=1 Tax=Vibrio sp. DW001 TaxID=2912315 RepID=UPI0023AF8349|nr:hypothetical protein [Vibrio sp. DW001]WED25509.1 hypothetical protein L3V77_10565 [Vibrio sp. DW001]